MARGATGGPASFLVEHYCPGATTKVLEGLARRIRSAVRELQREGHSIELRSSTMVPGDEALLCVLEGASEGLVRETYMRADVSVERISAALSDPPARPEKPTRTRLELESREERP